MVTIHKYLKTLEQVGLIQKSKTSRGNNVYVVYKPLGKNELYGHFPDKVEQLQEFEKKLMNTAEHDKERYQLNQQKKEYQEHREQKIQARQIVPKIVDTDLSPEEIRMQERLALLPKKEVQ
ncbi:hypothetical protein R4Z09_16015 [Niallia oryzisoli]|uniref:Uncharacterized protein n=1 Tax=Niallia oryzisoli TaxID=1737571 RepID=A0ABZ2C7J7_9BACI